MNKSFIQAVFVLAGTTIGAGIFGIPYVTVKAGYGIGLLWMIFLTAVVLGINCLYVRVILKQDSNHPIQLVGLGEKYFGKIGKTIALWLILIGQWGAMLAYIIGIGNLLVVILGHQEYVIYYSIGVFIIASSITYFNIRVVSAIDFWLTTAMVAIIGLIAWVGFPAVDISNIKFIASSNYFEFLLPFGVIFGALTGYAVIPEVVRISRSGGNHPQKSIQVVILGTLIPAVVYLVFQYIVVGVSGSAVTEEAVNGLTPFLNNWIVDVGAIFGILAMVTSHLTLTHVIKDMFNDDFHINPNISWVMAILPPFIIFLLGMHSFIVVLDFMGTWLGITSAIFIFLLYRKSQKVK